MSTSSSSLNGEVLTIKEWDQSSTKQRIKLLKEFFERYSREGVDGYDTKKIEKELKNEIVLLISRIVASLEIAIQKSNSVQFFVCALCALISTNEGQTFAETSPNVIPNLMQCLQSDIKSKEDDLLISLVMIRKTCIFNEKLRTAIVDQHGMEIVGSILQQNETSQKIQEAACAFLLDLSTLNQNTTFLFSNILRTLFNTPFLLSKHAAIKLLSSILITASPVIINFSNWEHELIVQLTRVLICAPLQYQYDASELISMLLENENELVRNALMSVASALLCVRYTLGGHSIVDTPQHWEYLFSLSDPSQNIHEVPEILVSVVIMTALSSLDDIDLTQLSSTVTQLKAKFDILTTNLRTSKLHRSLLSHILWYVREKAVLHKVLSIWVDRTDLNLQSNDSEQNHKTKFRKVAKVARQWIQRKSSVSGVNNRCTTPPELRRASVLLKSSSDVAPNVCDTEATSQDLACINSIRVLQKWLEVDQMAKDDIVSDLTQLGYSRQISYIPLEGASMGMETIDLLPTLSNIVRIIKANGSENQQVGKNSYFSTYLSQLVTPGELVKSLKVNLSNSLQHDMGSVYPLLSTSSSSTISAGENIGNNNFIQHQEMTTQDLPFMPPPLQSNPSLKTNSSVTHTSSNTHTNTNANSISQTTLHPESEPIHALPSPPLDSGNRNHRPTAREKRINSNFYTKQYTDSNGAYSDIEFEQTEIREPSNARFILRDGTPAKSHTGEKITILTPQDRLTLSTMTPQKPTKLGDLKPSPPKGSPDALHSLPEPNDGFSPGKGRFVRQSLLRQRSSNSEEAQSILKTEDEIGNKNTQRSSILIGGGIQHGAYTQPSPPSKVQYSNIRPHSRGRVVGHESAGGGKGLSELMDITAELDELKEKENEDKFSSITIPPTTTGGGIGGSWAGSGSGSAGAMTEQQMELEQRRLHHLNNVVGQLLDDEESLLAELESEHLALSAGLCPSRKFPITDPLIPNTSPRSKGLSTQQHNHHQQQHTPVYFPDPNAKLKTTSYTATLSQRKEKDHLVLQAIANADSVHFSDVTLNGKSVGAKQHHRESNEENRTFFPGIY